MYPPFTEEPSACCRLVLTRYIQWMVTTPTLVYIVSKISDFTNAKVATAVLTQISVILSGLISSVVPSPWKCESESTLPFAVATMKRVTHPTPMNSPEWLLSCTTHVLADKCIIISLLLLLAISPCLYLLTASAHMQLPYLACYYTPSLDLAHFVAGLWMAYCMVAYVYVMYSMGKMLQSAISESADSSQRQGLLFIYYGTVVIWSTFAVVWFAQEFKVLSIRNAELGNMLANFAAKVGIKGLTLVQASDGSRRWSNCSPNAVNMQLTDITVHQLKP